MMEGLPFGAAVSGLLVAAPKHIAEASIERQ